MKTTFIFPTVLILLRPTVACLHAWGTITHSLWPGLSGITAQVDDNGGRVCSGGSHFDQDGHYSLTCVPGYVYAVTQDGGFAWYRAGSNAYSWIQPTSIDHEEVGHLKNTLYSWDVWLYC
ncbi:hypothetical protein V500_06148 [Pseudogymnoascus sp. VKM F-4518 (FW-2643)]|nr:hypothetical protein V500_06148 [Pseudogymnoascus sp. VKM F-4518 (FW-2643)]